MTKVSLPDPLSFECMKKSLLPVVVGLIIDFVLDKHMFRYIGGTISVLWVFRDALNWFLVRQKWFQELVKRNMIKRGEL